MTRPRLGLALGSGSARGWSHIGILGALAERGLRPDVITGASVGALVGAACAAGRLADLERWVCTLTQRDVWRLVDTTFRGGGVMTGNRLMSTIAEQIGDAPIESLPIVFGAVATDLYTGEEIWLREGLVHGRRACLQWPAGSPVTHLAPAALADRRRRGESGSGLAMPGPWRRSGYRGRPSPLAHEDGHACSPRALSTAGSEDGSGKRRNPQHPKPAPKALPFWASGPAWWTAWWSPSAASATIPVYSKS
jgi:hypothetical protein